MWLIVTFSDYSCNFDRTLPALPHSAEVAWWVTKQVMRHLAVGRQPVDLRYIYGVTMLNQWSYLTLMYFRMTIRIVKWHNISRHSVRCIYPYLAGAVSHEALNISKFVGIEACSVVLSTWNTVLTGVQLRLPQAQHGQTNADWPNFHLFFAV